MPDEPPTVHGARRASGSSAPGPADLPDTLPLATNLSPRLARILDALPLRPSMRVLEIGCGPGSLARAIPARVVPGHVLGIDRSGQAIASAEAASRAEMDSGRLSFRRAAVEAFALAADETPFDLAIAIRVGALDGRHPELEERALRCIAAALAPHGRLFIDGGDPLRGVRVPRHT